MNYLGVKALREALPNCHNFLMLDRVEIIDDKNAVGVKLVTNNELFFEGHFPNHPIMPGVLQLEGMRQLCEILSAKILNPNNDKQIYLKKCEKVKFRKPTTPGDRVKICAEMITNQDDYLTFKTTLSNNSGLACEAQLTLGARYFEENPPLPQLFTALDKSESVAMDSEKTKSLMPHRYPFLLIDYIAKIDGDKLTAIKNVSGDEPFFAQMPNPVMPEALLCEIGAQAGCAAVLSRPENSGKLGFFMSIDHAEVFKPIIPGDQLEIRLTLPPSKGRFGKGECQIFVEGSVVFESSIMFAIVEA